MGVRNGKPRVASKNADRANSRGPLRTVELFAGIGGFRIAADPHGLETVWANDLCHQACGVYRKAFGSSELHEGDIRQLKHSIPEHDLLTAGFPCQPFSNAGRKEGLRDARGTLFREIIDVLEAKQPRIFILENVKRLLSMERGFHFATILSSLAQLNYHIEWRLLNAMHFGLPQNRQRVFIVGTLQSPSSLIQEIDSVRLATAQDLAGQDPDLIASLWESAHWKPIGKHGLCFPTWGMARSGRFIGRELPTFSPASKPVRLCDFLQPEVPDEFDFTETTLGWIDSNTPVNRFIQGVEILSNQGGGARMGYTIFGVNGVAPTLTSTASRHYERYQIGNKFRRLTNVEYARIQGFPDDHCSCISVYNQYALFGNAVPPPMACWVIDRALTGGVRQSEIRPHQQNLFSYAQT